MNSRRDLIKLFAASPLMAALPAFALGTEKSSINPNSIDPQSINSVRTDIITRAIPVSQELLPGIGMGSYQTFNVTSDATITSDLSEVLNSFFAAGGSLIDSSPMYGRSESMLGELIAKLTPTPKVFTATKVWTYGEQAGIDSVRESLQRMKVKKIDLMQVHNLRDWKIHLPSLQAMQAAELLRYTGITTSRISQYNEFEQVMKTQKLDFIQVNYNIKVREAEKKILPLALEKGIGVIVNMPYEKGGLFKSIKGKSLPEWAIEFDCHSWGQFFLKFILSHPAVTCVIPATSKVHHMQDNMQAMVGRLPDQKMRRKMLQFFETV